MTSGGTVRWFSDSAVLSRPGTKELFRSINHGLFMRLLRSTILFLTRLATVFAAAGCSYAQRSTVDVAGLVQQLREGHNDNALVVANKLLVTHPNDCKVLSLKAIAAQSLGYASEALLAFQTATKLCPTYLPALEGAAQVEYAQQSPDALTTLARILSIQPENATAHAMSAVTLQRSNRCAEALSHFEASRSLFPTRSDLLQESASCLAQTGDYKAALDQYLVLLDRMPSDAIRYDVALLQWRTSLKRDALETLAPMLAAANYQPAFSLASHIEEELGDTPHAVDFLRTAIQLQPDRIDEYLDFANIAFTHQSFQVGIDVINVGISRLPNAAPLFLARGVLEVQLTRSDEAVADFEQAHRLDPKLSFAIDALGMMSSQKHDDATSLALFKAQVENHPEDPLLQYLLAEQLAQASTDGKIDQLQAAIAAAERAIALEPTYRPAHDLLATLYLRANNPKLAIKEAEVALKIDPNDDAALYQELMATRRAGNKAETELLTQRLKAMREQNANSREVSDRYRLQDNVSR